MRILLTGNRGKVGSVIEADLQASGHEVVGFDRLAGGDILDLAALEAAVQGCDAVIHLAALLAFPGERPSEIMQVNLQGAWHVLVAAAQARVKRLVMMSSVDALGVFKGERRPDYLPLDDAHPCYPATPYAISKRLAEEMCRFWSESTGIPVVCLRPPGVWTADTYDEIQAARQARPSYEWEPYWEYGAFIDVRDLSTASTRALAGNIDGFACLLVSAADVTTSGKSSQELARFVHPEVEWQGGAEYQADPFRSLLVTDKARDLLDWQPKYTWRAFVEGR